MKFQNSGKFQNNAINDVTVNDVTDFTELCDYNFELTCWNFLCKLAKKTEKNISHISQQLLEMYMVTFQVGGEGGGRGGGRGGLGVL